MATKKAKRDKSTTRISATTASRNIPSSQVSRRIRAIDIRSVAIAGALIILGAVLFYLARNLFLVATVNGEPISRSALTQELERQAGKQVLNSLITKVLVLQEAKRQGVTISDAEITAELKKIEDTFSKQGQKLSDVMRAQGVTTQSLRDQIKIQKLAEKIVGRGITVSDKEVNDYMEANKDKFEGKVEKSMIKEQLRQQKINSKIPTWVQDLQKKAKINYFI